MLGEILAEIALDVAGDVIGSVAPAAINMGVAAASAGINFAVDKYNDAQKVKNVKKILGVEKDAYLDDAIKYYNLLDDINAFNFESQKTALMKV